MAFDYYKHNTYKRITGGAVHCRSGKVEITHGIFEHNKGAALVGHVAQIRIKSCWFSCNTAAKLGGGVHATMRTYLEIFDTTIFEDNVANYAT